MWLELGHLNCDICVNSLKSLSSSLQTAKALGKLSVFTAVDLTTTMGLKKKGFATVFSTFSTQKEYVAPCVRGCQRDEGIDK